MDTSSKIDPTTIEALNQVFAQKIINIFASFYDLFHLTGLVAEVLVT